MVSVLPLPSSNTVSPLAQVFVDNKKYACETCIKGHRSSTCKHADRPLFEIKKKGRPITQCSHCRELRKTKQVHVKCSCADKQLDAAQKKGTNVVSERAAFPDGLPEAMKEAMAASDHTSSEASLSDSERSDSHLGCICGLPGDCSCCTPRKNIRKELLAAAQGHSNQSTSATPHDLTTAQTQLNELARARYRALRPAPPRSPTQPSASYDPSSSITHKISHHHPENMFSPYPRPGYTRDILHEYTASSQPKSSTFQPSFNQPTPSASQQWGPLSLPLSNCGCGEGCQCPGCAHHRGFQVLPLPSAFLSCHNPSTCISCLDCTILSLPPISGDPVAYEQDALDELIRQIDQVNQPLDGARWSGFELPNTTLSTEGLNSTVGGQSTSVNGSFPSGSDWSSSRTLDTDFNPLESIPMGFENLDAQSSNSLTSLDLYNPMYDLSRTSKVTSSTGDLLDLDQGPSTSGRTGIPLSRHSTITQHHFQSTPNLTIRSDVSASCCSGSSTPSSSPSPHPQSDPGVDYGDLLERTTQFESSLTDMRIF